MIKIIFRNFKIFSLKRVSFLTYDTADDVISSHEIIEKLIFPETDFWHDNYLKTRPVRLLASKLTSHVKNCDKKISNKNVTKTPVLFLFTWLFTFLWRVSNNLNTALFFNIISLSCQESLFLFPPSQDIVETSWKQRLS